MDYVWVILTLISSVVAYSLLDNFKRKVDKRPPGPYRLPIIGNLVHFLPAVVDLSKFKTLLSFEWSFEDSFLTSRRPAYLVIHDISANHGDLTCVQFGVNSAVIVGNSEYARQVLYRGEFAYRFADGWFVERQFKKKLGLIFNNGKQYRSLKMFTMKHMKDFGLGKTEDMEVAVEEELVHFLTDFEQKAEANQNLVPIHHIFTLPVLNILWQMVAGIRFSYDNSKMHRLITIVEEISRTHDLGGNILMAFPYLRFICPEITGHNHQMQLYDELKQFFWDLLEERKNSYDSDSPRDFVDVFVNELRRQEQKPPDKQTPWLTEEQFVIVCLDLFTAGSETTANTLEFALLFMLLNPNIQKKVQEEIDEVIGPDRLPRMHDRHRMVYTNAVLLETQRMCNVIPLVHRVTTRDTKLGPYNIKKGDVMVLNMHTIHKDARVWEEPSKFMPERFLDSAGNLHVPNVFLPFGMGKRICMGENLAKHTLFTYFTSILQRYHLQMPEDRKAPTRRSVKGYTITPEPFTVLATPRCL